MNPEIPSPSLQTTSTQHYLSFPDPKTERLSLTMTVTPPQRRHCEAPGWVEQQTLSRLPLLSAPQVVAE